MLKNYQIILSKCLVTGICLGLLVSVSATEVVKSDRNLKSTTRTNCLKAIDIVKKASIAHGAFSMQDSIVSITFDISGGRYKTGDANAPSAVREKKIAGYASLTDELLHANYTFWYNHTQKRHYIINEDRVANYRSLYEDDSTFIDWTYPEEGLSEDREAIIHLLPNEMIRQALDARETLRWLGEETINGSIHDVISISRLNGISTSLLIERQSGLVSRVEELDANFGRGDVTNWHDYSDWIEISGFTFPGHYESRRLSRNSFIKFSFDFLNYQFESEWNDTAYRLPHEVADELGGWVVKRPTDSLPKSNYWGWEDGQITETTERFIAVNKIEDDLFLIRMPFMDSQIMFYEFEDHVVVFEAPINSATGSLVIQTIKEHTDKPIRYVVSSHHHDHYYGGLRPFIHEGATIIAANEGAEYIKRLAEWPHIFVPDELEFSKKEPNFKILEGKMTLSDSKHAVTIYDVGPASGHTDEYLVFYFKNSKTLFNGDLVVYFRSGMARKNKRALGLYNLIEKEKLEIDWIYNSWPINKGTTRRGTMKELKARLGIEIKR